MTGKGPTRAETAEARDLEFAAAIIRLTERVSRIEAWIKAQGGPGL